MIAAPAWDNGGVPAAQVRTPHGTADREGIDMTEPTTSTETAWMRARDGWVRDLAEEDLRGRPDLRAGWANDRRVRRLARALEVTAVLLALTVLVIVLLPLEIALFCFYWWEYGHKERMNARVASGTQSYPRVQMPPAETRHHAATMLADKPRQQ